MNKFKVDRITKQSENFATWYTDVVQNSELMSYGPIKGTMFIEPYGQQIWDNICDWLKIRFKQRNIFNVSFPLIFPLSYLKKEKEHVNGFAPEVLLVSKIGDKELNDPFVIRPTSEVLFCKYFSQKVQSKSDLPMKLVQWGSVIRWEKTTRPFLRSSEFHWHEGHTIHASKDEAIKFAKEIHYDIYNDLITNVLLLPAIVGEKSPNERFAGAENTFTIETFTKDGQSLQAATSHYLGQKFAKVFDIKYQNQDNNFSYVEQTSWGISTRIIGALIMVHGDDNGLVLPFDIAPYQIVINKLFSEKNPQINKLADELAKKLEKSNYRVLIDNSNKSLGEQASIWDIKGVPIRIEIGPKDIENEQIVLVTRHNHQKEKISPNELEKKLKLKISEYQDYLQGSSNNRLKNSIVVVNTLKEFEIAIKKNVLVEIAINLTIELEEKIKDKYQLTIRCIKNELDNSSNLICPFSNLKATHIVYIGRAY